MGSEDFRITRRQLETVAEYALYVELSGGWCVDTKRRSVQYAGRLFSPVSWIIYSKELTVPIGSMSRSDRLYHHCSGNYYASVVEVNSQLHKPSDT